MLNVIGLKRCGFWHTRSLICSLSCFSPFDPTIHGRTYEACDDSSFWPGKLLDKLRLCMPPYDASHKRPPGVASVFQQVGRSAKRVYPGHDNDLNLWPVQHGGYLMQGRYDPYKNKYWVFSRNINAGFIIAPQFPPTKFSILFDAFHQIFDKNLESNGSQFCESWGLINRAALTHAIVIKSPLEITLISRVVV